jgi:hypothetical protein
VKNLSLAFLIGLTTMSGLQLSHAQITDDDLLYVCTIVSQTPEETSDPVKEIFAQPHIEHGQLLSYTVIHVTASGKKYSREAQYTNFKYEYTDANDGWSGTLINHPELEMSGKMFLRPPAVKGQPWDWYYQEVLERNHVTVMKMLSACTIKDQ